MKSIYLMTAAAVALVGFSAPVKAETVTTKVTVQQKDIPDVNKVNLTVFDADKNGILSMKEVGQYLFKIFDNDKNGSIDNIEFKQKRFMTIIPMEKETTLQVDFDDDGMPEKVDHSEENFIKQSQLMRFDDNMDGLSPNEFINTGYEVLDDDEDKLINAEEWDEAYMELTRAPVNEPERYQN